MGFRIQDLSIDVVPGGLQMANERCTCAASANPGATAQRDPGAKPGRDPGRKPGKGNPADRPDCQGTAERSRECPPRRDVRAADLAVLRAELRRGLAAH